MRTGIGGGPGENPSPVAHSTSLDVYIWQNAMHCCMRVTHTTVTGVHNFICISSTLLRMTTSRRRRDDSKERSRTVEDQGVIAV